MKTIQIRHVPDEVHRTLKSRAALAGMSLSDYALAELRRTADLPTWGEVAESLDRRRRGSLPVSGADAVHEGRAERDAEMAARFDQR